MKHLLPILALVSASACLRAAEERTLSELEVGVAEAGGVRFEVEGGLAHVRAIAPGELRLWASAPVLDIDIAVTADSGATTEWTITIENCMTDAELTATEGVTSVGAVAMPGERPTMRRFGLRLLPGERAGRVRVAPPDAADTGRWRFAVMGDIQTALGEVHEVFARINQESDLRFVVSTGDLVEAATLAEYELLETQLQTLEIPYYSTIGNHELRADHRRWLERYGRFNVHFRYRGVAFSLIDSGGASIDPLVYGWLDEWLQAANDDVHIFGTHYPPLDPVGVRSGSFRSRKEASKLLAKLAAGNVDLTLYGHIHSYYAFSNADIPAYISGGGGALPERWDGIGRHFLTVDVSAEAVHEVAMVRVD